MANSVDLGSVYATLDLKTKNFESGIASANSAMGGFKQTALGVFAGNLITQGVNAMTRTIVDFGKTALETAGNMEQWRVSFDVMLGSADRAKTLLTQISDFAIKTPFDLPQVVQGAKSLLAYGVEADKLLPTFASLGNIAAGVGKDKLPQLILAFGQVKAATKLTGAELRQFTEAGVPLLEVLAKQSGKTAAQVKQDMEDGAAPSFAEVEKALASMSGEGGRFFNLMEKQSKTFGGTMSNIRDSVTRFSLAFMGLTVAGDVIEGGLFDRIRKAGASLQKFLSDNADTIQRVLGNIGGAIVGTILTAFDVFGKALKIVTDNLPLFIGGLIGLGIAFGPVLIGGITAAASAMFVFAAGVWATLAPLLPFIAIGALVGVAIDALVNKFSSWSAIGKKVTDTAKSIFEAIKLIVTGDFKGGIFGLAEDAPFITALITLRKVLVAVGKFVKDQFLSIWDSLKESWAKLLISMAPIIDMFQDFWKNHGDKVLTVLKYLGIALGVLAGLFIAAPIIAFLGALKLLAIVIGFVGDHFQGLFNILKIFVLIALSPIIISIGLLIGAFKLIKGAITGTIDFFVALYTGIVDAWQKTQKAVSDGINAITNFFTTGWNTIRDTVVAVWQSVYNAVVGPMTAIANFIMGVLDFIKNLYIIVFGSILLVILTIMGFIKDGIIAVWTAIYGFLAPIVQGIWNFLVNAFNTVKDAIINAVQTVWDGIVRVWNGIVAFLTPIINAIVEFFIQRWENLKANTIAAVQAIWNFMVTAWNGIKNAIVTIVQQILNFFAPAYNWLIDKGREIIQGLIDGIASLAGGVSNAVKSVADRIGAFFSGAGSWLYGVGQAIVQGLVNGIRSMVGAVSDAASSVGNAVKSKLKGVLGINSPSKVTAQFGVFTGQGFIKGLDSMQGKIATSVADTFGLTNVAGAIDSSFNGSANRLRNVTPVNNETNSNTLSIYGDINISNQQDADYLLSRLSRKQDLTVQGLVGA